MPACVGVPPAANRLLKKMTMMRSNLAASISAGALHVEFQRLADRYAHQIIYSPAGSISPMTWASQEGTFRDAWPPSPPLQTLHLETRPDGSQTIMLIGMAGRSHWSMSVEAVTKDRLYFDVACRISESPVWLGSTYHCANQDATAFCGRPTFSSCQGIGARESALQIDCASGILRIPVSLATNAFPQSVRWRYTVAIAP